jgi:hypothetical protein
MSTTDHIPAALAWPNLTEAAELVGVSASTLSRQPDLQRIPAGRRDQRVRPREVLRAADLHKKRSLNEVAQELIDYAERSDPRYVESVEEEVEGFFAERTSAAEGTPSRPLSSSAEAFLQELKGFLPQHVYNRARVIFGAATDYTPGDVATPEHLYDDTEDD